MARLPMLQRRAVVPVVSHRAMAMTSPDYGRVHCRGEGMAAAVQGDDAIREIRSGLRVQSQQVVLPVTNPVFVAAGGLGAV